VVEIMLNKSATITFIGVLGVVSAFVGGCAASTEQTSPTDVVLSAAPSPTATDVTTINGQVPPGTATAVDDSVTLLDVVDAGVQHLVYRDTRSPGTRSPIHQHPYGGTTCVISGEMTLYLQGSDPQLAGEGECYWMPPGLSMTGVNTGENFAVMIDTFAVVPGQPVWYVVEPGHEDAIDEFGGGGDGHM
jgi:quercetin dioxygenase-like cupin family protein